MNRPAKNAAGKEKPVSRLKIALVGLLAAATGLPLGVGKTDTARVARQGTPTITQNANETKQAPLQAPATAGQSINVVRGLDGMTPTPLPLTRGRTPKEWGMSRECARMSRNHKMRRLGVGGQRI